MKTGIIILIALFILPGFVVKAQNIHHARHHKKKLLTETQCVAIIRALPETKNFLRYADKKELPDVIVDSMPDTADNWCYRIKVAYTRDMIRSALIFTVDPKTGKVYYEDFMSWWVSDITLQQWRYWRNDPRFEKPHIFKGNKIILLDNNGKPIHGTKKSSSHHQ